jgi:predicted metal-dependent hydrolase
MKQLLINGFDVSILRTKRKHSVSIQVNSEGVKVLAPRFVSLKVIKEVVIEKSPWIEKKLNDRPKKHQYKEGERVFILGQPHVLSLFLGRGKSVIEGDKLVLMCSDFSQEKVKNALEKFLKIKAQEYLTARCEQLAKKTIDMVPFSIKVKSYRARWGSCSQKGEISFNWKLICQPISICDYVIIHELCHLIHFNHSKAFWQLVETHYPLYKKAKKYLSQQICH